MYDVPDCSRKSKQTPHRVLTYLRTDTRLAIICPNVYSLNLVYNFRPHRSNSWMRPVATDGVFGLSVGHVREPWTDRDAVCGWLMFDPRNHELDDWLIDWLMRSRSKGFFFGGCTAHWKTLGVSSSVYAAKGIIYLSIAARCAMRLPFFVKILWPLVCIFTAVLVLVAPNFVVSLCFN